MRQVNVASYYGPTIYASLGFTGSTQLLVNGKSTPCIPSITIPAGLDTDKARYLRRMGTRGHRHLYPLCRRQTRQAAAAHLWRVLDGRLPRLAGGHRLAV